MSAPEKEERAVGSALKTAELLRAYHAPGLVQSGFIWRHWEREAARLFSLFWRTADQRHLRAFATHVEAMRGYAGRRQS
jgi:hypothetical protein